MKLYLFGGAETDQGQAPELKKLINEVLQKIQPKQLLHVPYARIEIPEDEVDVWGEGWVPRDLDLGGIELLDARSEDDLERAGYPTIFMNGGPQRDLLFEKITTNKRLKELVMKAEHIIGESSGAMMTAEFRRTYELDETIIREGLGFLPNTIIEAHYVARKGQQALRDNMRKSGANYGIGIDSIAGVVIDTDDYPGNYELLGTEVVEFLNIKDLD